MINSLSDRPDNEKSTEKKIDDTFVVDSLSSKKELGHYQNAARNVGLRESEKIIFQKYLNLQDKILDIGCGAGRTTFGLYELGYHNIIGVDLTKAMINSAKHIAKEKGMKIDFSIGDAKHIDAPNNSYDAAIFSFNGLMMIPGRRNRLQAMKEIERVLKDKGYFIFTTHDRGNEKEEKRIKYRKEEKIRRNTGSQILELFEFGDQKYENRDGKHDMFIHIPDTKEIISCLKKATFAVIESQFRSEIASEPQKVVDFSKECKFWVAQKI